jgi:uncharacterized protein (TIRG00374 family)
VGRDGWRGRRARQCRDRDLNEGSQKNGRISRYVKLAVGIILSLVFLYLAARNVDFRKIPDTLGRVDYVLYGLSIAVYIVSLFIKAMQVRTMLSFGGRIRALPLVPPIIIGYYCNNIFPLKAGEVIRTSLVARKLSLSFWSAFSAMLLERSLDIVFVLLIALLTSFFVSFPGEVLVSIRGFVVFLFFVYAFFVALAVTVKRGGKALELLQKLVPGRFRAALRATIERFADGLWAIKRPLPLVGTLLFGSIFWLINMMSYWLRFQAFGLPSSPGVVGFFVVVIGLGVSIPSAPSYVGVFHLLVVFALGVFGVGKNEAFSFALISHAVDFVVMALLGNVAIVMEGISLKALKRSAAVKAAAGGAPNGTG